MLNFTVSVALNCAPAKARALALAGALCAANAMGSSAKIRWPGDVMLTDKTVCRVSSRRGERDMTFDFSIDPEALRADPAVLRQDITRALTEIASRCPDGLPGLIQDYCARCVTLMKFVNVTYRGMPVYGFAFALDKHGGLMVMTQESHTVITVYSGPAELAPSEPEAPDLPPMPRI